MIPKIIHQTWKTKKVPSKWLPFVEKVKRLNPDWEYRLWSDEDNDAFVQKEYPEFYPFFKAFDKNIMRADVIRYLIMDKIGGVYLDLDYEMLEPFDFGDQVLVLPKNRSLAFGDNRDALGNCVFASSPDHVYWKDVIKDLSDNPPKVNDYNEVIGATGPQLLTRIFYDGSYPDAHLPERLEYHPPTPKNNRAINKIKSNGVSKGIHHPWGSWREKWKLSRLWKA